MPQEYLSNALKEAYIEYTRALAFIHLEYKKRLDEHNKKRQAVYDAKRALSNAREETRGRPKKK